MLLMVLAVVTFLVIVMRVVVLRGIAFGNPVWYFSLINWLMVAGSVSLLEIGRKQDVRHAWVLVVATTVYSLSATVTLRFDGKVEARTRQFWSQRRETLGHRTLSRLSVLIAVSGAISMLYFYLVGYNLFLIGVSDALSGSRSDFATLRLQSYAGDRYFAPGYANQFKNAVFPLSVALLLTERWRHGKALGWRLVLPVAAIVFLVGAGQRGAFVLSILTLLLFLQMSSGRRGVTRSGVLGIGLAFSIFSLLSFLQGRFSDGSGILESAFGSAWDRAFRSNQGASVAGFRIVSDLPIVNGREWVDAALGLLPGRRGSDLSSVVYAELFGGTRGTAPVSVWGSFWHNGGWLGIVVGALVLGWVHATVYRRLISGSRHPVRLMVFSATVILLSTWVAGSFTYILNNGLLGLFLMVWFLKQRNAQATPQDEPQLVVAA